MSDTIKSPRKLIEVALPLDAINFAAAREKSIRHGHPSTLHLWWARRPLAAARAVIFGQMVNDPSWRWEIEHSEELPPSHLRASWAASRKRLFSILEDLVKWESTTNEEILEKARAEIRKSWCETCQLNKDHPRASDLFNPDKLPGFHDPFAGGGAIPLEAQRLGLEAFASDLNPVAVLISKAMIEIPPKFNKRPPVNREWHQLSSGEKLLRQWGGSQGLAEDVRHYGRWICDEAFRQIGSLYPPVEVTAEMARARKDLKNLVGQKLTVSAWIWARTVKSPNPAFKQIDVPLASSFMLCTKEGSEVYVEPEVGTSGYEFNVKMGRPRNTEKVKSGTKFTRGNFSCLMSGTPIDPEYIRAEARAGRMGVRLMAVIAESKVGRVYLSPTGAIEQVAFKAKPAWKPDVEFFQQALGFRIGNYGMTKWSDLFSQRQLVALTTFSDLVHAARDRVKEDALEAGLVDDSVGLQGGGSGASAYADAVSVYLAMAVSRATDYWGTGAIWEPSGSFIAHVFTRNALPMTWDYPEANPFSNGSGSGIKLALNGLNVTSKQ